MVGSAPKQANPEGRADSLGYIWGKLTLCFITGHLHHPSARPRWAHTFVWMVRRSAGDGKMRGDAEQQLTGGFLVRRYRYERRRSDVIGVGVLLRPALH